ncbi:MAG: SgcJ/EcaC family oxidoreductase [Acidobacteria bacterium]|nr:SgcJ/EcaC family oxidoreductase [Acidobacteriota bacterium]
MTNPEDIAESFQNAWNSHDMAALGSLFCEDATFVNRFGHFVQGVPEIIALHAPIHQTIYSDSTVSNEVFHSKVLSGDVAVVHCWSRLTVGTAHPAGPHAVDTMILAVMRLQSNGWLILALENVTLTNPRTGEPVLRA